MPEYGYQCPTCESRRDIYRRMNNTAAISCSTCNVIMRRVFTVPLINWNGRPPSQGGVSPIVQQRINTAPQRVEQMKAKYEARARGDYGISV